MQISKKQNKIFVKCFIFKKIEFENLSSTSTRNF